MSKVKSHSSVMRYFHEPVKDFNSIRFYLNVELDDLQFYLEEINKIIESRVEIAEAFTEQELEEKGNLTFAYNYQNQPHNILRESILISLVTILERYIDVYCESFMIHYNLEISYKNLKGSTLDQFKTFTKKVLMLKLDFDHESWKKILGLYEVRNILVHRGGQIPNEKLGRIENFVSQYNIFSIGEEKDIQLTHSSCLEAISSIKKYFHRIIEKAIVQFEVNKSN